MPLLDIKELSMHYKIKGGWVRAVDNVSLELDRGESLGLVGESGCGKTSLAFSILGLLPPNAKILKGSITLDGIDLLRLPKEEARRIRWNRVSMIFQAAMNALDPVEKIGDHLIEALRTNKDVSKEQARSRARELFELVGLPEHWMDSYPHELSGGMKQRVIIAMSLVCNPDLIIADEPTTALDVIVQDQILQELLDIQKRLGISMMVVSHDISIICETCHNVAVMYGGRVMECADTASIFKNPRNPYTIALLRSYPSIRGNVSRLMSLPGAPPNLIDPIPGCPFAPRCPIADRICTTEEPPKINVNSSHYSCCHFAMDRKVEDTALELEA